MSASTPRRTFLRQSAAFSLGFAGLHRLFEQRAWATPRTSEVVDGYGALVEDPAGIFDLPEGFSYQIISRVGDTMTDGFLVPGTADGMAAFEGPDGKTLIIRNHELNDDDSSGGAFGQNLELLDQLDSSDLYDFGSGVTPGLGGTTTMLYNTETGTLEGERLSLAGTIRNCAGGPTPWNSWITCEETVRRAGGNFEVDHGYNFDVPATWPNALAAPVALTDMGRFNHEAIAVDPASGVVFQTEDAHDGLIYRFLPNEAENLAAGGRLQALAVIDQDSLDTRNWDVTPNVAIGEKLTTRWIDMENVTSPLNNLRTRGFSAGAAKFARGEGMWYAAPDLAQEGAPGYVYWACTNGGRIKKGQIWRYTPSPVEGQAGEADQPGVLELFIEPNNAGILDNADNLTVAPWGDLIVCEDGSGEQNLVGVQPSGDLYRFGHNAVSTSELAGACFSPDGSTLFVNIQKDGLTLAITGPWRGGSSIAML